MRISQLKFTAFVFCLLVVTRGTLISQTYVGQITRPDLVPTSIAVYEPGNKLCVADSANDRIVIFDGTTLAELASIPISLFSSVTDLVVNETYGKLYAASFSIYGYVGVAVVDLNSMTFLRRILLPSGIRTLRQLDQDEALDKVYVLYVGGLGQIDVATDTLTVVPNFGGGGLGSDLAVNPVTHEVFVCMYAWDQLEVFNGITLARTTITDDIGSVAGLAVNYIENTVVLAYNGSILDRDTNTQTSFSMWNDAMYYTFDPVTNRMFSSSELQGISTIIDGGSNTSYIPMTNAGPPGVRFSTGHVYYPGGSDIVALDEETHILSYIRVPCLAPPSGFSSNEVVINQGTGRVFAIAGDRVTVLQDEERLTQLPVYLAILDGFDENGCEVKLHVPGSDYLEYMGFFTPFPSDPWRNPEIVAHMAFSPGRGTSYTPWEAYTYGENDGLSVFEGCGFSMVGLDANIDKYSASGTGSVAPVVTPDGTLAYLTNAATNDVSVIDLSTRGVLATIPVGASPFGAAISPTGSHVYVANWGGSAISVIDTATRSVTRTIAVGGKPWGVAINPAGTKLYVSNYGSGTVSVIDIASAKVVKTIPVGISPRWLAISPDGKRVFLANYGSNTVSVIDAGTDTVIRTVNVDKRPEGICVSPLGEKIYVGCEFALTIISAADYSTSTDPIDTGYDTCRVISVAMPDPYSRFAGRITAAGSPLKGALVRVIQAGVEKGRATTNESGDFSVFGLDPGTYDVEASESRCPTQSLLHQTVQAGRTAPANFDLVFQNPTNLIVTAPLGGESWKAGTSHDITWTTTGVVANVRIEYATSSGSGWSTIIASTPNVGAYSWPVPNTPSTMCSVRVSEASTGAPADTNDAVFTILTAPSITIISPNGGESWVVGSSHDITWTTTGTVGNVRIRYSTDGGASWTDIIASTAILGAYAWTVPNAPSSTCLVQVSEASGGGPADQSNAVFSIVVAPAITIISPNGGESWAVGSSHNITWTSAGAVGDVKIEYQTSYGGVWAPVIPSTPNSGSYAWTIPSTTSPDCRVRISEALTGIPVDISESVFAIVIPIPVIQLSRTSIQFGSTAGGVTTPVQSVVISNVGPGTLYWAAYRSSPWITLSLDHGTGNGMVNIGVNPAGLSDGEYNGTVEFRSLYATNSPQTVAVNLSVYDGAGTQLPFGDFATPSDGAINITGAIPITGWVLDDVGMAKLEIWRDPVLTAGEVNSLFYIGDGLFVEEARPDVEAAYPTYPMNYKAGWGYMLLTNFLPNQGNGTYKLHAIATDLDGHTVTLGTKTITCNNAHAVKPFGTIDTPGQGGTSNGTFYNFG